MKSSRLAAICVAFGLILDSACRAPSAPSTSGSSEVSQPVSANRDKHGPPNLSEYIEKLQSPERVADLGVDKVIEKLHLSADAEVGDLGCGPGIFSIAF